MKGRQSKLKFSRVKKYLFTKTTIHEFKLYSLSLQLENIKKISAAAVSGSVL